MPTALYGAIATNVVGLAIDGQSERETLHLFTRSPIRPSIRIGDLRALNDFEFPLSYTYTGRFLPALRPASGGDSIGHFRGGSGTFACTVADQSGRTLILSCNHVLADLNSAIVGDIVVQPGSQEGGTLVNRNRPARQIRPFGG